MFPKKDQEQNIRKAHHEFRLSLLQNKFQRALEEGIALTLISRSESLGQWMDATELFTELNNHLGIRLHPDTLSFLKRNKCLSHIEERTIWEKILDAYLLNELIHLVPNYQLYLEQVNTMAVNYNEPEMLREQPLSAVVDLLYRTLLRKEVGVNEGVKRTFNDILLFFRTQDYDSLVILPPVKTLEQISFSQFIFNIIRPNYFFRNEDSALLMKNFVKKHISHKNLNVLEKIILYFVQEYCQEVKEKIMTRIELSYHQVAFERIHEQIDQLKRLTDADVERLILVLSMLLVKIYSSEEFQTKSFHYVWKQVLAENQAESLFKSFLFQVLEELIIAEKQIRASYNEIRAKAPLALAQCYEILELKITENFAEIKKQYHRLLLKYQSSKSDEKQPEKFRTVFKAYQRLDDYFNHADKYEEQNALLQRQQLDNLALLKKDLRANLQMLSKIVQPMQKEFLFIFQAKIQDYLNEILSENRPLPEITLHDLFESSVAQFKASLKKQPHSVERQMLLIQATITALNLHDYDIRQKEYELQVEQNTASIITSMSTKYHGLC